MATKVVMEALSPTMEEGRLVEWKKQEGDSVQAGDVLAEVETDKAVMELVARVAGTLLKQAAPAGATIPVSALVGWIGQPGESIEDGGAPKASAPPPAPQSAPAASQTTPRAAAAAVTPPAPAAEEAPSKSEPAPAPPTGRVKASPLARRIASERGVDLRQIAGSGPEGRVVKRDVDAAPARTAPSAPAPRVAAAAPGAAYQDVPLTQIRKTIAKRLVQSIGPIPTFYLTTEIDMERVAEAREALLAAGAKNAPDTPKISFNDIVIKAVALALRQHPACNAWWQDDRIRVWNEVHVGMAVAVEEGLITPVIRHADQLSLREISAEAKALAGRARERKLTPEEYTGATFSISNLGMFDIEHFTAVINPPEAGILAVGTIAPVPAVVNGQVAIRRRMRVTMSCDHRVIDGATGATFLKTLKTMLENPLALVW